MLLLLLLLLLLAPAGPLGPLLLGRLLLPPPHPSVGPKLDVAVVHPLGNLPTFEPSSLGTGIQRLDGVSIRFE